jgi:hypothetical protein
MAPDQAKIVPIGIPEVQRKAANGVDRNRYQSSLNQHGEAGLQRKDRTMRVMVIVKATKSSEAGAMPSEKLLTDMGKYNEELVKAGILLAGEGLHPTTRAKRLRFSGETRTLVSGPFPHTEEQAAGFWLWQVKSMDEAIAWARRCPAPMPGEDSELELRPVLEAEDFGAELTPELRAREERLRAQTAT